jgi:hypothetical protein
MQENIRNKNDYHNDWEKEILDDFVTLIPDFPDECSKVFSAVPTLLLQPLDNLLKVG